MTAGYRKYSSFYDEFCSVTGQNIFYTYKTKTKRQTRWKMGTQSQGS